MLLGTDPHGATLCASAINADAEIAIDKISLFITLIDFVYAKKPNKTLHSKFQAIKVDIVQ